MMPDIPDTASELLAACDDADGREPVAILPFAPWHLDWLNLQASQQMLSPLLTPQYGRALQDAGPCYTAFAGDTVIACAGVVEFWNGRSQVWSLLGSQLWTYRKTIHKSVKTFLDNYHVRRLECVVDPRSASAIRWARRLGFVYESTMRGYTPGGDDQDMYVRIE